MSKFKLKSKAVTETGKFQIEDAEDTPLFTTPDKEGDPPLPVTVELYGPGSKRYAAVQAKYAGFAVERYRKRGKITVSADTEQAERANKLAELTVGFGNIDESEYGNLQGHDLFVAIYSDREVGFIADFVAKKVDDWANFPSKSPTN